MTSELNYDLETFDADTVNLLVQIHWEDEDRPVRQQQQHLGYLSIYLGYLSIYLGYLSIYLGYLSIYLGYLSI